MSSLATRGLLASQEKNLSCADVRCYNQIPAPSQRTTEDKIKEFVCGHDPICSTCAPRTQSCPTCKEARVKVIALRGEPDRTADEGDAKIAAHEAFDNRAQAHLNSFKKVLKIATVIAGIALIALALLLLL